MGMHRNIFYTEICINLVISIDIVGEMLESFLSDHKFQLAVKPKDFSSYHT